jgi:hypothetical protein
MEGKQRSGGRKTKPGRKENKGSGKENQIEAGAESLVVAKAYSAIRHLAIHSISERQATSHRFFK